MNPSSHPTAETSAVTRPAAWKRPAGGRALPWVLAVSLLLAGAGGWWWRARTSAPKDGNPPSAGGPGAGAFGGGAGGRRSGAGKDTQPVSVDVARKQNIGVIVNAIGSIAASNTATVRAQVSGVLQNIAFREGEQVRAGQLLAQIDPRAFQASLTQAQGTLARDTAQLENARTDLARYQGLMSKDAIAKQQLDTQAALVRQLEGSVKADQGTVDSAQLQLSYTRVLAPIGGRVGLKQADLGNVVQPADPNGLVVITQTRPIALVFSVPAEHIPVITERLRAKQALAVQAWSQGGKQQLAVGRVATLDNAIDPTTNSIRVKALFPNSDDTLFPNQSVAVRLQLDSLTETLAVPQAAVLRGTKGFYVYVVNPDNTVATRVVKPGAIDGEWMAITGPVQPGDKVVIDGTDRLREGAKVEIIATDPRQRAGANLPARSASAPSNSGAADERPRWMDKLPPEEIEKLKNMTPEERKAWRQKMREQSGAGGAAPSN